MFEMKNEYLTGIEQIDSEHVILFGIGERAYKLLKDPFTTDKYDRIIEIIEELKDYTVFHFSHEEELMERINYSGIATQKSEHAKFIKRIEEVDLDKIDENQDEYIMEILNFMADWLVVHIVGKDTVIKTEYK